MFPYNFETKGDSDVFQNAQCLLSHEPKPRKLDQSQLKKSQKQKGSKSLKVSRSSSSKSCHGSRKVTSKKSEVKQTSMAHMSKSSKSKTNTSKAKASKAKASKAKASKAKVSKAKSSKASKASKASKGSRTSESLKTPRTKAKVSKTEVKDRDEPEMVTMTESFGQSELVAPFSHVSQLDFGFIFNSNNIQSAYTDITEIFMGCPRYHIHHNMKRAYAHLSLENDDIIVYTSRCFWMGFAPVTVSYNFKQIPIMTAYLMCKKCTSCKQLNMKCNKCAFSGNTDTSSKDTLIQKWITQLPFAPMHSKKVRKELGVFVK